MPANLEQTELVRLVHGERRVGPTLASVSRHWQNEKECFLMVSPHDDDVALGAGLFIQLCCRDKIPVHILIVTDGSMGYCDPNERENIAEIRQAETLECYQKLGVPLENIHFLGFPSGVLHDFVGRFPAPSYSKLNIKGYTGMQNAFTWHLRRIQPTQCFLPTNNDFHPAHRLVYDEFLISLFHASGRIWPELGQPLPKISWLLEMAVYCEFSAPPTLRVQTPMDMLETKLQAIACFRSQKQIAMLVENIRNGGPLEFFRGIEYKFYSPKRYYDLFEPKM